MLPLALFGVGIYFHFQVDPACCAVNFMASWEPRGETTWHKRVDCILLRKWWFCTALLVQLEHRVALFLGWWGGLYSDAIQLSGKSTANCPWSQSARRKVGGEMLNIPFRRLKASQALRNTSQDEKYLFPSAMLEPPLPLNLDRPAVI